MYLNKEYILFDLIEVFMALNDSKLVCSLSKKSTITSLNYVLLPLIKLSASKPDHLTFADSHIFQIFLIEYRLKMFNFERFIKWL